MIAVVRALALLANDTYRRIIEWWNLVININRTIICVGL